MKHFGIAQWVDFARGLAAGDERAGMQDHLASGCTECRQIVDFCDRLAAISREMAARQVPESAVRLARAIFRPPAPQAERAFRIPAELIFDSFLVPAPAGLRATWQVGWQALYRAGDCSVDLRIEPDLSSSRMAVIGQIANHTAPEMQMADLPVSLKSGKLVVAETRSNRFGEFQMEYEQRGRMQLCVELGGGSSFQAPLKKFAVEKPVSSRRTGKIAAAARKRSTDE